MAVKYLDAKRLQGTNAERLGMNLGVTPTAPTVDTTTASGYVILKYLSGIGTFTPTSTTTVEYLVVGGGSGGNTGVNGVSYGSGGAGGQLKSSSSYSVTAQNYDITVGDGGAGVVYATSNAGGSSVFGSITATGGGSIANSSLQGASNADYSGSTDTGIYGGGGASSSENGKTSGNGGDGTANSITGTSIYYATGAGGGAPEGIQGIGGSSEGNDGSWSATAGSGINGRGSGGGSTGSGGTAGSGGSGIVVLKFADSVSYSYATVATNLPSGTIFSTTDTYKYYWWDGTDTWSESG